MRSPWALFIVVIGLVFIFLIYPRSDIEALHEPQHQSNCIDAECSNHHGKPDPCPEGTYEIGVTPDNLQRICKDEPTGCPYGDSIPLDSPKCVMPVSDPPSTIRGK